MKDEAFSMPDLTSLLDAAGGLIPADAVVAAAGVAQASVPESSRTIVSFDDGQRPADSAVAIVALERNRSTGVSFLALPAPTDHWLDELPLFADHCRRRYPVVLESELGTVFALRPAVETVRSKPTRQETSGFDDGGEESANNDGAVIAKQPLDAIDALALPLSRLVRDESYSGEEFRRFEQSGVHVTRAHFYSPIPDTSKLTDDIWQQQSELVGIDMNDEEQLHLLREVFPQFRNEYEALPTAPTDDHTEFYFGNGFFGGTDALALYCMLRHLRPRRVVEVGSGHSTRLAAQAARENGSTELICIEPYPDEVLQEGFEGVTSLITAPVEDVSLDRFTALEANDVLFIDSSHVVRVGGDVSFLFLEVLPRLQPGVVIQVHDVFLPHHYPREWVVDQLRFWNEQYLLQAFLSSNSAFRVLLANSYLEARYPDVLRSTFPTSEWWGGGSFWFQKEPHSPTPMPSIGEETRRGAQRGVSLAVDDPTLREIGSRTGTDKAESRRTILDVYDQHLRTIRVESITLLEIGVFRGESLRMWRDYFPRGRIYGVDIDREALQHEGERIRVFIGDQSDQALLDSVIAECGQPDIIVDDGSHLADDQIGSLLHLWPHLKPGGYYIVEDTHTSYLTEYNMGLRQPGTTIEFLKSVIDDVHAMWHDGEITLPACEWIFFANETCLIRKLTT